MDREQAKRFGGYLRQARETKQLSLLKLAEMTAIHDATLGRIENGAIAAPAPDKLKRIAEALELSLADVYSMADYAIPGELPTLTPYLRSKYRDLPDDAIAQIAAQAERLARKHGVELTGPAPGQDEQPEP